ncbi:MAG: glycosyltransferase [Caldilineaceae bacterium]
MSQAEFQVVAKGQGAPQASVLLPTYRSSYLAQALGSILGQSDVILEILVSDDASDDGTPQRIRRQLEGYHGPHRVLLRQGQERLQLDHFALLVEAASCEVVIMAHDDDLALPHRARRVLDLFMATGADVISSNCLIIDARGRPLEVRIQGTATGFIPVEQIIEEVWLPLPWAPPWPGAAVSTQSSAAGHLLLTIRPRLSDPVSGALGNGVYYTDEVLLQRRRHAAQWSNHLVDRKSQLTGQEARAARFLGICVAMQKDIAYRKERTSPPTSNDPQRLAQLDALVTQSLIHQATTMLDRRSQLLLAGQQMIWVDAATFTRYQRPSLLRRLFQHEPLRSIKDWMQK